MEGSITGAPITLATQQQENVPSSTSTVAQPRQEERLAALEIVIGAMQKLLDAGYRSPKSCFIQKLKGIDMRKVSSLFTCARVAKTFSEKEAREFGIFKLNVLMMHQMTMHNQIFSADPGNHEVSLLRDDGTTLIKKFRGCSVSAKARCKARAWHPHTPKLRRFAASGEGTVTGCETIRETTPPGCRRNNRRRVPAADDGRPLDRMAQ